MCGIAGALHSSLPGPSAELLRRMLVPVRHRGPDGSDIHCDGRLGLAHTRLSIIDVEGGHQPMCYPEARLAITFNGEIFNYVELRAELEAKGHRFRTRSDTEVILHMYEAYGEECVHRFNGQWAFALWDAKAQRLFLSRDRVGILPLYYTEAGGALLFASEIKSLLAHPEVVPTVDLEGLDDVFTFWTTVPPRTMFRSIRELRPGHNLVVTPAGVREVPYWRLDYHVEPTLEREDSLRDQLRALLADAVRIRLRADVPVGAYLSGGLDSSLLVSMIHHDTDTPLETFSVVFSDQEYDERGFQQAVVDFLGTEHTRVECTGEAIGRIFPRIIQQTEKPILRTAPAPLFMLSELVQQSGYKVVLTGEGADEVFGGYDLFKEAKIRRFWSTRPDSKWRPLLLRRLYPYMPALQAQPTEYLKAFFHLREEDTKSPFFSHVPRWELTASLKTFYSPQVQGALRERDAYDSIRAILPERYASWPSFCQAQYLEAALLLPGYILSSQGDRMAMAHSIEGRFPYLDHRVIEFASRLDPRLKMRTLDEKYLLKRVAEKLVPEEVRRRSKQPYRAPDVTSFFFGEGRAAPPDYVRELLSEQAVEKVGLFAPQAVAGLVRKCERSTRASVKDSMALVGILSTQLWVHQFLQGSRSQASDARD